MRPSQNNLIVWFFILVVFLSFFSLSQGTYKIEINQILKILFSRIVSIPQEWALENEIILLQVRLPRILLVVFVGISLSVSGAVLQSIFRNPLVSPFILGISSGASLGASLVIVFFSTYSFYVLQFSAFLFSLFAVLLVLFIISIFKKSNTTILIISGIVISSFFQSIVSLLQYFSEADKLQSIVFWNFGSFNNSNWDKLIQIAPITIMGTIVLILNSWKINVLSLGDEESKTLGINTEKLRIHLIIIVSLMTSTATALTGPISWIGLVIPNIARILLGANNTYIIIGSAGLGAAFMLLVDLLSRNLLTVEIPVGIVTSILGVPFFIYILYRTKKNI